MAKRQRSPDFGTQFDSAYRDAQHAALVQTLRDLAQQPEMESQIAARDESIIASRENRGRAAKDQELQDMKAPLERDLIRARINNLSAERDKLLALTSGEMKPADMIRFQQGLAKELNPMQGGLMLDEADRVAKQKTYDAVTRAIERMIPEKDRKALMAEMGAGGPQQKAASKDASAAAAPTRHVYPDGTVAEWDGKAWKRVAK